MKNCKLYDRLGFNKLYFITSALAFFCLNMWIDISFVFSVVIAIAIWFALLTKCDDIFDIVKKEKTVIHLLGGLTAVAACWQTHLSFSYDRRYLNQFFNTEINVVKVIGFVGACLALYFVYIFSVIIYAELKNIIAEIFLEITKTELCVYGAMIVITSIVIVLVFTQTNAFYGSVNNYDIIYTSDSPYLVKGNVYLRLTHPENDLRQPLFAVFATPFMGVPYLLGKIGGKTVTATAIMMNIGQTVMLYATFFILSRIMELDKVKRICFVILCNSTYMGMLFTLMMEQYIVACFWLMICIYYVVKEKRPSTLVACAAGGTLLTSMVLLPFMSENSAITNFKQWFRDCFETGIGFLISILMFARFDIIYNIFNYSKVLSVYTGAEATIKQKLILYTAFIDNCFTAQSCTPKAIPHMSWQLSPIEGVNCTGVAILIIAAAGLIINRKRSSVIAAGWILFSMAILVVLGWGVAENGLVLYSLYFGWAFLLLGFQLVEKIEDKFKTKFIIPAATAAAVAYMMSVNIPSVIEMVRFAIEYYAV